MQEAHKLIIDIGNSSVKYCLDSSVYFNLYELESAIKSHQDTKFDVFIVSTVAEKTEIISNDIKEFFAGLEGIELGDIEIFDPLNQNYLQGVYAGIGADRIAKLSGALRLFPDKAIILLDFGTASALSIGVPNKDKADFLGGFITLGFKATLKALSIECDALDDLSTDPELDAFVNSYELMTEDISSKRAMIYGSYGGHLGLVDQWLERSRELVEDHCRKEYLPSRDILTICTGGQARFFSKLFDKHIYSQELLAASETSMRSIPERSL